MTIEKKRTVAAVASTITTLTVTAIFAARAFESGNPEQSMATWLLFGVAVVISLLSQFSVEKNALNLCYVAGDVVGCWAVVVVMTWKRGWVGVYFNSFEMFCFGLSATAIILWLLTGKAKAPHRTIQVVMTIAYFPTYHSLWLAPGNTQPWFPWILGLIGSVFALYPPWKSRNAEGDRDWSGVIYALRAMTMVTILLSLMAWKEWGQ